MPDVDESSPRIELTRRDTTNLIQAEHDNDAMSEQGLGLGYLDADGGEYAAADHVLADPNVFDGSRSVHLYRIGTRSS